MSYYKDEKDIVDDGSKFIAALIVVLIIALIGFAYAKYGFEKLEARNAQLTEDAKTLRSDYDWLKEAYLIVTSELEICQTK